MKHRITDLEGALLDAAVAKAESRVYSIDDWRWGDFAPSANWQHGGPIIERERITVISDHKPGWIAAMPDWRNGECYGATPLIAAMRAYVASKLGEEVDLP